MQIASGELSEHGTMFISWMLRPKNAGPYIDTLGPLCNISQLTRGIWGRFMTLLMTTSRWQEILLTSGDLASSRMLYLGFGIVGVQLMLVVHKCRNVCIPVCYDVILLIRLQFIE